MSSIFSKIIAGEIPSYKVAENDHYLAFLDIFPIQKGHTLVIPKTNPTDKLFDLEPENYSGLMNFAYQTAKAIEQTIDCNRVGVAVLGLEVPHAHVHLIPIQTEGDLNFANPKLSFRKEEFQQIAEAISSNFK